MANRKLIGDLAARAVTGTVGGAVRAARHPVGTASYGVGVAKGLVKIGARLGSDLARTVAGQRPVGLFEDVVDPVPMPEPPPAPAPAPTPQPGPAEPGPEPPTPVPPPEPQPGPEPVGPGAVDDRVDEGERVVDAGEDVTGAEAAEESLATMETEPQAASRQGAHGGPDPEERLAHWGDELTDDVEVETPVGTTGAGPGYNPDTGETDLQQPGTEPLMDPSLTKAVRSEAEIARKGAARDKG